MLERLTELQATARSCAEMPVWALSDDDLVSSLDALHQVEQALVAAKLRVVREIQGRGLPGVEDTRSMVAFLHRRLNVSTSAARRTVDLASKLDRRPVLDAALGSGAVNAEQATVIANMVTELPAHVGTEVVDKAEAMLVEYAAEFDPVALRKLSGRVLWHVAPEVAERADAEALAKQEEKAYRSREFTLSPTGDGRVRVTGWLDSEAAAVVNAALDPLCSPRQSAPDDPRTMAQRRADALVDVCRLALSAGELPDHGGERPQVVVTVPFDLLRAQLGTGILDTGELLSPEQVRRISCDAQIIPAVLGGDGQVLNLGASRRLFTGAVRRALVLRDGGCTFPGCDRPARWCEGHHRIPWSEGGETSVDNGLLLCGHHHRVIHQGEWEIQLGPDRRPVFIPPAYIDPLRRPRRNVFHRRP